LLAASLQAVFHTRTVADEIRALQGMDDRQLAAFAAKERVPVAVVQEIKDLGRLPVVNFAAGGVATPADAALMMQLGCDGVFVGSGIFKSGNAAKRASAIVQAVTHFNDASVIAAVSEDLGEAMVGINCDELMGPKSKYKLSEVPE
jgi:pyridoxal 5'-phosphate synthase pdxS subunit